jgi:hypothetical protein
MSVAIVFFTFFGNFRSKLEVHMRASCSVLYEFAHVFAVLCTKLQGLLDTHGLNGLSRILRKHKIVQRRVDIHWIWMGWGAKLTARHAPWSLSWHRGLKKSNEYDVCRCSIVAASIFSAYKAIYISIGVCRSLRVRSAMPSRNVPSCQRN